MQVHSTGDRRRVRDRRAAVSRGGSVRAQRAADVIDTRARRRPARTARRRASGGSPTTSERWSAPRAGPRRITLLVSSIRRTRRRPAGRRRWSSAPPRSASGRAASTARRSRRARSPRRGRRRPATPSSASVRFCSTSSAASSTCPSPPGERRSAAPSDVPLLGEWLAAFGAEIERSSARTRAAIARPHGASRRLRPLDRRWQRRVPGRVTASRRGVLRVGPVYTPPEHRNHGYGRRLTYEVTAAALARPDVDRAMLFTDAANPVSNSIYRQAGYEPRERARRDRVRRASRRRRALESAP